MAQQEASVGCNMRWDRSLIGQAAYPKAASVSRHCSRTCWFLPRRRGGRGIVSSEGRADGGWQAGHESSLLVGGCPPMGRGQFLHLFLACRAPEFRRRRQLTQAAPLRQLRPLPTARLSRIPRAQWVTCCQAETRDNNFFPLFTSSRKKDFGSIVASRDNVGD
jgi:hypothetical protein